MRLVPLLIVCIKQSQRMLPTGTYTYLWVLNKAVFRLHYDLHWGGTEARPGDNVTMYRFANWRTSRTPHVGSGVGMKPRGFLSKQSTDLLEEIINRLCSLVPFRC